MAFTPPSTGQRDLSPAMAAQRPLKIGLLSYRSDPRVGGQGVYVDYLSAALADLGHEVTVISGPPYPELSRDVSCVRLPSLDLYAQPHHGHYALRPRHLLSPTDTYEYFSHLSGKFVEPLTFGRRAGQWLRRHGQAFDVLLDNQGLSEGILRATQSRRLPLVTMIHHPITEDRRLALAAAPDRLHRLLVRRWYAFHHSQLRVARKVGPIISPSQSARRHIATEFDLPVDKITAIPLGVDRSAFCKAPGGVRHERRIVTTASADVPLKGLQYLIDAFAALRADFPDLELTVIGTLREGAAAARIRAHGLAQHVTFKSGLSREDLAREFQTATLLVSPSLYEGFGLPAAEAMSCGTPVVVTDGGALPEVAGSAGLVVPRGNPAALAEAIASLLHDPDRRRFVGQACFERAEAEFNWSRIAPRYQAVFEEAIAAAC